MPRKTMIAAGHRLPESVAHTIRAEAEEQARTPSDRASAIRWGRYGFNHEDVRPYTALARRMYDFGRKLRAEHEEIRRYGPGPLHGLADFANNLLRTIAGAQGAYRGGI